MRKVFFMGGNNKMSSFATFFASHYPIDYLSHFLKLPGVFRLVNIFATLLNNLNYGSISTITVNIRKIAAKR